MVLLFEHNLSELCSGQTTFGVGIGYIPDKVMVLISPLVEKG